MSASSHADSDTSSSSSSSSSSLSDGTLSSSSIDADYASGSATYSTTAGVSQAMDLLQEHYRQHRRSAEHHSQAMGGPGKRIEAVGEPLHVEEPSYSTRILGGLGLHKRTVGRNMEKVGRPLLQRRDGDGNAFVDHFKRGVEVKREQLGDFLESKWAQRFILFLLAVDVIIVVVELLIDLDVIHMDHHREHEVHEALHATSITILAIFLAEQAGLLIAFGLLYFTHIGYVVDLIVIVTSLALELSVDSDTAGLIIILRFWRIVRIVHGVYVEAEHKAQKLHKALTHETEHVHGLENDLTKAVAHNDMLARLIMELGGTPPTPPSYDFVHKVVNYVPIEGQAI